MTVSVVVVDHWMHMHPAVLACDFATKHPRDRVRNPFDSESILCTLGEQSQQPWTHCDRETRP